MRKLRVLLILMAIITLQSCKKSNSDSGMTAGILDEYADGSYCADVTYYNPDTGSRSTYTLNVEVENHELTVIHWPNGGWLDDSHFSPQELDSGGSCSFTSDRGYQYDVQITGSECTSTDEATMSSDLEDDKNAVTCPSCGGDKDASDNYCSSCKDKTENTCSRCGGFEYYVYGGLCSSCKNNDEESQRQEQEEDENSEN